MSKSKPTRFLLTLSKTASLTMSVNINLDLYQVRALFVEVLNEVGSFLKKDAGHRYGLDKKMRERILKIRAVFNWAPRLFFACEKRDNLIAAFLSSEGVPAYVRDLADGAFADCKTPRDWFELQNFFDTVDDLEGLSKPIRREVLAATLRDFLTNAAPAVDTFLAEADAMMSTPTGCKINEQDAVKTLVLLGWKMNTKGSMVPPDKKY